MKLTKFLKFIWDGLDIPITENELQHSMNVLLYALKSEIAKDPDLKALNREYNEFIEFKSLEKLK